MMSSPPNRRRHNQCRARPGSRAARNSLPGRNLDSSALPNCTRIWTQSRYPRLTSAAQGRNRKWGSKLACQRVRPNTAKPGYGPHARSCASSPRLLGEYSGFSVLARSGARRGTCGAGGLQKVSRQFLLALRSRHLLVIVLPGISHENAQIKVPFWPVGAKGVVGVARRLP